MRDPTFGGQFKFLTQLNHILQTLFFVFSIFNDLRMLILVFFGSKKEVHYSPVQKFVDRMFVILFTLASMVGILFWSIFFYDRELILPAALDATYPRELNLFQHGWTAVIMWLELLIVNHHFHSVMPHILPMITIAGTYGLWTMCLYKQNGKWPYPFQDQLSAQEHILFYVCVIPIAILVIIFGKGLSILRYGNKVHRFSAAKKQKKN